MIRDASWGPPPRQGDFASWRAPSGACAHLFRAAATSGSGRAPARSEASRGPPRKQGHFAGFAAEVSASHDRRARARARSRVEGRVLRAPVRAELGAGPPLHGHGCRAPGRTGWPPRLSRGGTGRRLVRGPWVDLGASSPSGPGRAPAFYYVGQDPSDIGHLSGGGDRRPGFWGHRRGRDSLKKPFEGGTRGIMMARGEGGQREED